MRITTDTESFVQRELAHTEGGHDWFHIQRVYNTAKTICDSEHANRLVVELAALLHDIADSKFHNGDETIGPAKARTWLEEQSLDSKLIDHVIAIIENVSFKGGTTQRTHESIELDIVQDADRLDAIGAIGIARTFNYGGFKNRVIHDPNIPPNVNMTKQEYKSSSAPTINHFHEKL
ncbi:MAG TPA: phosphohydrolase, partial [Cryomorphaceae bacterium]|nr:phosphohydrolase [Cryomorphaceae bacterium]